MKTEAKVVADSVGMGGRLTTIEVTLHRFVLAEFNTHRVFSRNSASSRAIPVETQLQRIEEWPAYPLRWPCEQPGMQGGALLEDEDLDAAKRLYEDVRNQTLAYVRQYLYAHPDKTQRLHKSVINRLLEPFMWHTIVVSSTEWDNFWGLRCSPLAQPEMQAGAEAMHEAFKASQPVERIHPARANATTLKEAWHLPYIEDDERENVHLLDLHKVSVARCARVSSLHAGEKREYERDFRLYETLTSADPPHASPLEHVAVSCCCAYSGGHRGNFEGWDQWRHLV